MIQLFIIQRDPTTPCILLSILFVYLKSMQRYSDIRHSQIVQTHDKVCGHMVTLSPVGAERYSQYKNSLFSSFAQSLATTRFRYYKCKVQQYHQYSRFSFTNGYKACRQASSFCLTCPHTLCHTYNLYIYLPTIS